MTTYNIDMQQKRDTAANWTANNPVLLAGVIGWESDTNKFKIGDGVTAWAALAYTAPEGTAVKSTGEVGATKFLREDGDGTCSWQLPAGGGPPYDNNLTAASGNEYVLDVSGTVNQSGTAGYSGLFADITETATGSGSNYVVQIQRNGADRFRLGPNGEIMFGQSSSYNMRLGNDNNWRFYFGLSNFGLSAQTGAHLGWELGTLNNNTPSADCALVYKGTGQMFSPDGSGNFAMSQGTAAFGLNVYNTYTNGSNYERCSLGWNSAANVLTIATEAVGTGVRREITIDPLTWVKVEGEMMMAEQAAAGSSVAGYGKLWVKNTTPCQLWYTDDAGTSTQIV